MRKPRDLHDGTATPSMTRDKHSPKEIEGWNSKSFLRSWEPPSLDFLMNLYLIVKNSSLREKEPFLKEYQLAWSL